MGSRLRVAVARGSHHANEECAVVAVVAAVPRAVPAALALDSWVVWWLQAANEAVVA